MAKPALSYADSVLLEEHLQRLDQLALTHRQFADSIGRGSDCAQTKSGAMAAASKTARLAKLIRRLKSGDPNPETTT